ncbi:ATP-binding protein [Methanosarcina barkeri]|uniref:Uncharacterized protein n=1 Tax=Methanosarcina barkeri CM1 TaxID=796385 RepID=A0A0G3C7X1_METBA|nr:ATP-binding protein [Methanosarcina barkeri]AKJ38104.1 hypothetical protein MCM1_1044 [Methanosarcina barkeri CM1]
MQIQREVLLKEFSEFAYSGNGIIVGSPGIGKTYILKKFSMKLIEHKVPFIYLPVDKLNVETESDLKIEIGIKGDFIDFLKSRNSEKSGSIGFLLIDAFDAARSEKTQRVFMNLIHRAVNELGGLWNVIVSVRIYDARKSEELIDLFPDSDIKSATEEIPCRHFFVPKLTDEEIIEAIETIPCPTNFLDSISLDLKELFRIPFYLWVLEKLLNRNQNISELSSISSEVQLLNLFWKQRITDGILGESKQMLLTKIAQKMVENHSLSVNKADFYPVEISTWNSLLSSEILVKVSSTGQRIAFSHNILFDYAVSVLLMEDSPDKFIEFIEEDPSRPLFLRPSLIYYFTRIWYSDPKLFWDSFWYILPNRNIHLRLFTRFLPTGVIADEARKIEQLTPLIDSLEKKEYYSTEAVVYLLQALRTLEIKRDQLWARFLDKVACDLDKEFAWDLAILTSEILHRTEKKDDDIIFQICGSISRSLLQWVLQERKSSPDKWIDSLGGNWATFLVAETFGTNPQGSRELLEKILGLIKEENFPINYIFRLIDSLTSITPYDPSFTAEIYLTVLAHEEKSKEPTYFGTPVVPLSSTRSQDFEMCHHQLIEHFPNFLETNPLLATETAVKCLNSYVISKHVLPYYKEEQIKEITQKFQFRGKLAYYIPDGSHIWWNNEGPQRYDPTKMAETLFEFIYKKSLSRTNHTELETSIDLLRDNACVAFFWKLLLKTAIRDAKNFAPFICDLCIAKPIQIESDTTYEFGEFLQVASTEFTEGQLYQIEKSILHIPEDEIENNRRQHLEKYRDRLLTRIPTELIKTEEGKQILEDIKKTNKIPENKPLVRFESFSKSFSEDDWFEEQGINLSEPSNEKIRTYFPKLNDFISKWQNEKPTKQDIELVFPDIEQLLYLLLDETSDAHEEVLTSAWTKLASCAKIISKNIDHSEKIFDICREILLTCSKHLQPDSNSKYNLEFNSPCWSPYPRTEAAEGLARIAAIKYDDEILNVIRDLTKDKVPSVRYLIDGQLFRISKNASYEFWKLVEDIVETEDNQLVLQSLCYNFDYLVVKEEDKTINILKKLIKRFSLADQNSSLLETTVPLIVWLALVRENNWAIETYREVISDPIKYSESLKRATFDTITSYLTPQKFDSINDSKVAKRAIDYLLATISSVKSEIMKFIYVSEKNETIRSKIKDVLEIIDEIIIRLYFAVDIKDKRHKEEMPSDKQMKTYYENIKPLLEQILIFTSEEKNIMNAMTAHYFMELLNCVLKYDPKGVLKLATKVAKSSQTANYNLDIIAIKETVKLVETILADHKLEVRDEESIKNLIDLLDIFSISGSPEALKLVWKLDTVFR